MKKALTLLALGTSLMATSAAFAWEGKPIRPGALASSVAAMRHFERICSEANIYPKSEVAIKAQHVERSLLAFVLTDIAKPAGKSPGNEADSPLTQGEDILCQKAWHLIEMKLKQPEN